MEWGTLLSVKRLGKPSSGIINEESRTQFQRDFDRLIFSSPFRRLQNKTQVFPLPGSIFVHNRLTHSLEVSCVGRSLGNLVSEKLKQKGVGCELVPEIGAIVAAACLAHDLGNPPFGHSGEDAIKEFFKTGSGVRLIDGLSNEQKSDFTTFDGNANAFRMMVHSFNGRREGGFALTYSTLASIVKYPYESIAAVKKDKFGFFQSEKEVYEQIAQELAIKKMSSSPLAYVRHPLVYLVEAADDICYQIMDLEDAHKLKILSFKEIKKLYTRFFDIESESGKIKSIEKTLKEVTDTNEQVAFLRAGVISLLVNNCLQAFMVNYDDIMNGNFQSSLIKELSPAALKAMKEVKDVSVNRVYCHPTVLEIELAGNKIISTLLEQFTHAILNQSTYDQKLLKLVPEQFSPRTDDLYTRIQSVVDFISGMTDLYALELYRKITGIGLPVL
jgi:dGTPase